MKTFEYRLYLKQEQAHLLMACLAESRQIYNSMLEMVKQQYEEQSTFPSKYDIEHAFKGQGSEHVPATTVQMLADRLTKALKRFLAAKANDIPGIGFPRFKQPNRWHSIQLRQYGKDAYLHEDKKHLIVPKKLGHFLKIKLHRQVEGTPKTVHLVYRADGHWSVAMWQTVMSMPLRIFSRWQGQGMAFRSQRTPMGAAFPEKPLRLRMGSCHHNG